MNIKEHIEAGHYPDRDDKGRTLVPTKAGALVVVYATDACGGAPIVGSTVDIGVSTWLVTGEWGGRGNAHDLLPPPPRKMRVTGVIKVANPRCLADWKIESVDTGEIISLPVGTRMTFTAEHEEPWS